MRRIIAALALAVGLAVGPMAAPADAHTVPTTTTRSICLYIGPNPDTWTLYSYRTIHVFGIHVTQCAYTYKWPTAGYTMLCRQLAWEYSQVTTYQHPSDSPPYCW